MHIKDYTFKDTLMAVWKLKRAYGYSFWVAYECLLKLKEFERKINNRSLPNE